VRGVVTYILTCLLCAASPTIGVLIGARFAQGLAGGVGIVIAQAAATLGAALATAIASLGLLSFRVPLHAFADAKNVPLQIVIDFGIITLALVRRVSGKRVAGAFVVRSFESAGSGPLATGDRGARAVLATYSPNAYVVEVDPGRHTVLLHDLVPNRSSEEPA